MHMGQEHMHMHMHMTMHSSRQQGAYGQAACVCEHAEVPVACVCELVPECWFQSHAGVSMRYQGGAGRAAAP